MLSGNFRATAFAQTRGSSVWVYIGDDTLSKFRLPDNDDAAVTMITRLAKKIHSIVLKSVKSRAILRLFSSVDFDELVCLCVQDCGPVELRDLLGHKLRVLKISKTETDNDILRRLASECPNLEELVYLPHTDNPDFSELCTVFPSSDGQGGLPLKSIELGHGYIEPWLWQSIPALKTLRKVVINEALPADLGCLWFQNTLEPLGDCDEIQLCGSCAVAGCLLSCFRSIRTLKLTLSTYVTGLFRSIVHWSSHLQNLSITFSNPGHLFRISNEDLMCVKSLKDLHSISVQADFNTSVEMQSKWSEDQKVLLRNIARLENGIIKDEASDNILIASSTRTQSTKDLDIDIEEADLSSNKLRDNRTRKADDDDPFAKAFGSMLKQNIAKKTGQGVAGLSSDAVGTTMIDLITQARITGASVEDDDDSSNCRLRLPSSLVDHVEETVQLARPEAVEATYAIYSTNSLPIETVQSPTQIVDTELVRRDNDRISPERRSDVSEYRNDDPRDREDEICAVDCLSEKNTGSLIDRLAEDGGSSDNEAAETVSDLAWTSDDESLIE
ncbi:hypothetical protein ANO11243_097290 [Dothideomycetidae sp. 11243]|nr:hypothetical protein ANO11243_097290 [fungal sp. No.11243]